MSAEENKAKARAFWEEGMNKGDLAAVDAIVGAAEKSHFGADDNSINTPESIRGYVQWTRSIFPDIHVTVDIVMAAGDLVAQRVTLRGTPTVAFDDPVWGHVEPSGQLITWTGMAINRFEGCKSVEVWGQFDDLGYYQKLGAITPRTETAA